MSTYRWVVCSGPAEFAGIVAPLLEAAGACAIEWEPLPARAEARLAQRADGGGANCLVAAGCVGDRPEEAAVRLASLGAGPCILCIEGASSVAGEMSVRGVTAAVEPRALVGLLGQLRQEGQDEGREPLEGGWDGDPVPDEVIDAMPQAVESSRDGPVPVGGTVRAALATQPDPAPPEVDVAGREHVPTVCFASARGGVGKSALAAITALALARQGLRVALIDLDFQFGTVLGYLGAEETDGLFDDAVHSLDRIDDLALARCRANLDAGIVGYEFCRAPEHAEVLAGMAGALVRAARAGSDMAVVDLPSGVSDVTAQAFELADRCLLVGDNRALSLESLGLQQALCVRLGIPRAKLVTVMNRCDPRHRDEGFLARVPFELQTTQIVRIADGGAEVMQMFAIGAGAQLVALRNKFALSTMDLARSLSVDLGCPVSPAGPSSRDAFLPTGGAGDGGLRKRRHLKRKEEPCR